MRKSFLTREFSLETVPGTLNMIEQRSFMASKILEIEDVMRLDENDIRWTENFDHTQGIGMDNLDRKLSSFQLKKVSHALRISPSQSESEKKLFTKWEFSFSIRKMIREFLFAKLKFYKTFASIESKNTYYNDINQAIYEYIDRNVLPRISFDTVELYVRYYPLALLQDNGIVALQYDTTFRDDLYSLQTLAGETTLQYKQRLERFKAETRVRNFQLTTNVSQDIANIVYKQTESSASMKFDYYFNVVYSKA